jgi:hypothetical protein
VRQPADARLQPRMCVRAVGRAATSSHQKVALLVFRERAIRRLAKGGPNSVFEKMLFVWGEFQFLEKLKFWNFPLTQVLSLQICGTSKRLLLKKRDKFECVFNLFHFFKKNMNIFEKCNFKKVSTPKTMLSTALLLFAFIFCWVEQTKNSVCAKTADKTIFPQFFPQIFLTFSV